MAISALIVLTVLSPPAIWWAVFALACGGILAAELFNTAIELAVDRLHPDVRPMIGLAKDCAAGAVLVMSFVAVLICIALLCAQFE